MGATFLRFLLVEVLVECNNACPVKNSSFMKVTTVNVMNRFGDLLFPHPRMEGMTWNVSPFTRPDVSSSLLLPHPKLSSESAAAAMFSVIGSSFGKSVGLFNVHCLQSRCAGIHLMNA